MLPHGLEPWTSRLLAERSSQLSYESRCSPYQITMLAFFVSCSSDFALAALLVLGMASANAPIAETLRVVRIALTKNSATGN